MAGESAVVGILRVLLQAETADYVAGVKDAEKTTTSLSRSFGNLARDLSGAKITEKALDVAKALQQVGGVSKLTARELASVSATVTAATDKLTLMGKVVPPELAKLSAEIQKVNAATPPAAGGVTALGSAFGKLQSLSPVLTVAGLATALIGAGKAALDSAGQIADLAASTGLSAQAIQEMQAVAELTGTTVETFTSAAFKLGTTVAEGSDKARDAVKGLGLSYADLKAQRPEDQFRTVVAALEDVDNQQERNRLGVALFGKGFKDMAAAVDGGYSQMAAAAVTSTDEQIRALDELGDTITSVMNRAWTLSRNTFANVATYANDSIAAATLDLSKYTADQQASIRDILGEGGAGLAAYLRNIQNARVIDLDLSGPTTEVQTYTQQLAAARAEVKGLDAAQRTQLNAALDLGGDAAKEYAESIGLSEAALGFYKDGQRDAAAATKKHTQELKEQAKKKEELDAKFRASVKPFTDTRFQFHAPVESAAEAAAALGNSLTDLWSTSTLALTTFEGFKPALEDAGDEIAEIRAEAFTIGKGFEEAFRGIAARLPDVLMGVFQGGGNIGKSLGGLVGGEFAASFAKPVGDLLSKGLGKTLGGALGSLLPGLGTALGGLAGGLADKLMGKLFKSGGKATNDARDAFTTAMGGIDSLVGKLEAAGRADLMRKFYDAKSLEEFARVQQQIEGVVGKHAADLGRAQQIAEKYGITLEEMGQGFKQKQTDTGAATFLDDIRIMQEAGVAAETIVAKTGDELAAFILEAKRLGTEVPKELEPFVAKMIEMGTLSVTNQEQLAAATERRTALEAELAVAMADSSATGVEKQAALQKAIAATEQEAQEATNSITDIGDVPFAKTMQDQFKDVMTGIKDLINVLTAGLVEGFYTGAREGTRQFGGVVAGYKPPGLTVPVEFEGEYHGGTVPAMAAGGLVTRPTVALIGEAGPELVTPLDQVGRLGTGVSSADLQGMVDGFARTVTRQVDRLEEVIAITVRDVRAGAY